eukprot:4960530-Pyramimonas_sp.AAC.1
MFDIVEGTVPFKPQITGDGIGKHGLQHQTPADLSQNLPKLRQRAAQCAENEWGIKIDGIIYG